MIRYKAGVTLLPGPNRNAGFLSDIAPKLIKYLSVSVVFNLG